MKLRYMKRHIRLRSHISEESTPCLYYHFTETIWLNIYEGVRHNAPFYLTFLQFIFFSCFKLLLFFFHFCDPTLKRVNNRSKIIHLTTSNKRMFDDAIRGNWLTNITTTDYKQIDHVMLLHLLNGSTRKPLATMYLMRI